MLWLGDEWLKPTSTCFAFLDSNWSFQYNEQQNSSILFFTRSPRVQLLKCSYFTNTHFCYRMHGKFNARFFVCLFYYVCIEDLNAAQYFCQSSTWSLRYAQHVLQPTGRFELVSAVQVFVTIQIGAPQKRQHNFWKVRQYLKSDSEQARIGPRWSRNLLRGIKGRFAMASSWLHSFAWNSLVTRGHPPLPLSAPSHMYVPFSRQSAATKSQSRNLWHALHNYWHGETKK